MWIFNSLRRRAPESFAVVALPVAIAIAGHVAVIGTSTVLAKRTPEDVKPETVVDNSRELVRLSRRVAQSRSLGAVTLNLSDSLPPPPAPDLFETLSDEEKGDDCQPGQKADEAAEPNRPDNQRGTPRQNTVAVLSPLDAEQIRAVWETGEPVESWPDALDAFPEESEVREVPLEAFSPRTAKQLNMLVMTSSDVQFLLRASDQRVWIVRQSVIE